MKKFVSLLLCAAMLCAVMVVPAKQDDGVSTCGLIHKEDLYTPESFPDVEE